MSVSAVTTNTAAATPPQAKAAAPATVARAADGDYKTPTANSSHVKDSDGDYKSRTAVGSTAKQSSAAVQAALSGLKTGG